MLSDSDMLFIINTSTPEYIDIKFSAFLDCLELVWMHVDIARAASTPKRCLSMMNYRPVLIHDKTLIADLLLLF